MDPSSSTPSPRKGNGSVYDPPVSLTVPFSELHAFVEALSRDWMPYNARVFFNRLVEAAEHAPTEPVPPADDAIEH